MQQATCRQCGLPTLPDDFARDGAKASGHKSICKACDNHRSLKYHYTHQHEAWEKREPPLQISDCKRCHTPYVRLRPSRFAYCSAGCKAESERERLQRRDYTKANQKQREKHLRRRLLAASARIAAWSPAPTPLMLASGPVILPVCKWCGCGYERTAKAQRYCSEPCAAESMAEQQRQWYLDTRAIPRPWIAGSCRECGDSFVVRGGLRDAYCSATCAERSHRRRAKQRRRRWLREVPREAVDLSVVAKRDGWRCHICKRKVTRKTWSLDHLVPVSDGGDHTYGNVALAHHRCNSIRGANGHAQLRLAG